MNIAPSHPRRLHGAPRPSGHGHLPRPLAGLGLFLALGAAVGASGATGADRTWADRPGQLRVDVQRPESTPGSATFEPATLQEIARLIGGGQFFVRVTAIPGTQPATSVVAVFPSTAALGQSQPAARLLVAPDAVSASAVSVEEIDLLRQLLATRDSKGTVAAERIEAVVATAIYSEGALPWRPATGRLAESADRRLLATVPERRAELKEARQPAAVQADAAGAQTWQEKFLRDDGGLEQVTLTLPAQADAVPAQWERTELRAAGYFSVNPPAPEPELWAVGGAPIWHPGAKYRVMLTMAALGNTRAKFQLGAALVQEENAEAREVGMKWLRAAADEGNYDAARLVRLDVGALRPPRDREAVRVERCGTPAPPADRTR